MRAIWKIFAGFIFGALLLVACGGSGGEPPEPTANNVNEQINQSVQQTMAAIAVAQTVEALTEDPATPVSDETATVSQPTPEVLPSSTAAATAQTKSTEAPTASPTSPPPTSPPPTQTIPPTATTFVPSPPSIDNDAPGGSFPQDGSVTFNIIVDPTFLFRMDVRVLTVGDFEGAGIESVGFFISGNGVDYFREERNAGFCVFGGGEPVCNPWPRNHEGQYTWGEGGPVVTSGDYFVNMAVAAEEPDEDLGGFWNWNFDFRVTVP